MLRFISDQRIVSTKVHIYTQILKTILQVLLWVQGRRQRVCLGGGGGGGTPTHFFSDFKNFQLKFP